MNIQAAKLLINQHNKGEIHIESILSNNRTLINNISANSKLNYNEERHTLTYVNYAGYVNTLTNVDIIDQIIYHNLNEESSDDSGSSSGGSSSDDGKCPCGDDCSCNDPDSNESFPEVAILEKGYIKNGIIYPTKLEDGTLIYDCSMGTLKEYVIGKDAGCIKKTEEIFSKFFGEGYALIKYGMLDMNIYIPDSAMYHFYVRAGSETNSGKRGSIFINNTERFVRTAANKKGIWEIKPPEKYCEEEDFYIDVDSVSMLSGTNKISLRIDQARGTINNAYDCLILKEEKSVPSDPEKEYFHITEKQYIEIKRNIEDLQTISSEMEKTLNRTFLVLDDIDQLLELPSKELTNGRVFKVNNIGNGDYGYYVYNKSSGLVKFDFDDPKAFITLDNYKQLKEFTTNNKRLLVHGKCVRINRPLSEDMGDDLTIEAPKDFYKPAYYYYDIHSEKWINIDFGSGSSITIDKVKELIKESIKEHNSDVDAHPNTFITVNSLEERDKISKVDGRIVRVNKVINEDTEESVYYRWDAKNSSWMIENFGGFDETTPVKVEQIKNFKESVIKIVNEELDNNLDEKIDKKLDTRLQWIIDT